MRPGSARGLLSVCYVLAALIILDQVTDLAVTLYPFHPDQLSWRLAAYGIGMRRTTWVLVADALVIATATGLEQPRVLYALSMVHGVAAILLVVGLGLFTLDTVQFRGSVRSEALPTVYLAAGRIGLLVPALVGFSIWAMVRLRRMGGGRTRTKRRGPPGLVVSGAATGEKL